MAYSTGDFETLLYVRAIGYCSCLLLLIFKAYRWARGTSAKSDAPDDMETPTEKPRKNVWVAYLLLCTGGGVFGAHHHYLGNYACGMMYAWSGGVFGLGVLYDFFTLWYQVRRINMTNGLTGKVDASATKMISKVLFNWIPKATVLIFTVVGVIVLFGPTILDRIGVIDLYALKGGIAGNPYEILEVPRYASFDQAKKSFRSLSLKYHPDRNPDCSDCAAKMADLNAAFGVIKKMGGHQEHTIEGEVSGFFNFSDLQEDWVFAITDITNRIDVYYETFATKTKKKKNEKKKKEKKTNDRRESWYEEYINSAFPDDEL
eukprot:GEMP01012073.1.p1 GENE.GEMP01012073.1~~GEMP01012073.1.p1  ORF type:complete len:317 (+),score=47.55 GEMP01012073.1:243-1193(+)